MSCFEKIANAVVISTPPITIDNMTEDEAGDINSAAERAKSRTGLNALIGAGIGALVGSLLPGNRLMHAGVGGAAVSAISAIASAANNSDIDMNKSIVEGGPEYVNSVARARVIRGLRHAHDDSLRNSVNEGHLRQQALTRAMFNGNVRTNINL